MTVAVIAGDTIIGKGRVKIVAPASPFQQFLNAGSNYFNQLGIAGQQALRSPQAFLNAGDQALNQLANRFVAPSARISNIPGSLPTDYKATEAAAIANANAYSKGAGWQKILGLPAGYEPGAAALPVRGQAPAAGAGPSGVSPNTIVQGQDGIGEEYRQRLNAYNNQAALARQALQGYDPSKGPLPGAAQEAHDQGMEIWKGLYGGTKMGQEGGAVGTFNPLMQAHGDVPSMAELWQGIGGGAPTAGPSQDAIKAAIARGVNQPGSGGFFVPPGSPSPVEQAQQQQLDTAAQAGSGTESSTALQRTNDYLRAFKLGAMNPNNYSLPGVDYSSIFK